MMRTKQLEITSVRRSILGEDHWVTSRCVDAVTHLAGPL
jgi:hypothetical protein